MKIKFFIAILAIATFASAVTAADRKPNFLFVYTDDQRWDTMSVVQREQGEHARWPWLNTPNMDRLANEGVRFRNAFVTLSLCAPSRAAFLTGSYNHLNGVANNHTPFPTNNVTHASLMTAAGYKTAYIGKWHHGMQRGQRPGFFYSASFIGQGRYWDCPFEINGESTPTKGWVDDVSTDFAIEFIKKHRDEPFSVVVGFKTLHGPRGGKSLPERFRNLYAGEKSRPVPNLNVPAIYHTGANAKPKIKANADANEPTVVPGHIEYMRHVAAADENLGRLLKALDELGLTEDTVVVFAGDNGYYLGEHELSDKRSVYEESLRIPMVIRYPKLFPKGKANDELVLNIDLAPTFLDLAGVKIPSEMQGRSWVPLLTGKKTEWRKSFLAEYFEENAYPQTPTIVAVRTTNSKLVKYPGHDEWTEVFDLSVDPYEMTNLAKEANGKAIGKKLQTELERQMKATDFKIPDYADKQEAGSDLKKKRRKAAKE